MQSCVPAVRNEGDILLAPVVPLKKNLQGKQKKRVVDLL